MGHQAEVFRATAVVPSFSTDLARAVRALQGGVMTDEELKAEVDRLRDELIDVIDGQHALASDYAMVEVLAAGCLDLEDCQSMAALVMTVLIERATELSGATVH